MPCVPATLKPLLRSFSLFLSILGSPLYSQTIRQPEPAPLPPPIAAPQDRPYPGTIRLLADITDVQDRVIDVTEATPVGPGPLTLLYPEWIPGHRSPVGPIQGIAGLFITANGKRLAWGATAPTFMRFMFRCRRESM